MRLIDADDVIAIIEEKQKALCPVGRYGRQYVYGDDRVKFDAWDEVLDAIDNIPTTHCARVCDSQYPNSVRTDSDTLSVSVRS